MVTESSGEKGGDDEALEELGNDPLNAKMQTNKVMHLKAEESTT